MAALFLCAGAQPSALKLPIPDIFVANGDGTGAHDLTNSPSEWDRDPAWSPDGKTVAYVASDSWVTGTVVLIDPSGANRHAIGPGTEPAWSPDGTKIALAGDGAVRDIVVVNADGSGRTNLTNTPETDEADPAWSPDGQRIVFARGVWPDHYDLYVMNADGSGVTQVTDVETSDVNPAWSPDGMRIAFSRWSLDSVGRTIGDIFTMNPDGSGLTRLTNDFSYDDDPAWSPDGTKIAFTRNPYSNGLYELDIFAMNADGSGVADLSNATGSYDAWYDAEAAWSPDGSRIAFDRSDPSIFGGPPPPPAPPPPTQTSHCRVPRLVGLRLAIARTKIRRAGCRLGRVRLARSRQVGRVLSQSPRRGSQLPLRGKVQLVVGRR
jgi:Tol biopolymer transport system component